MTARQFPLVSIRRADFGPRVSAARITCARCGETDEVVVSDRGLGEWVVKKFATGGWTVGANAARDLCGACAAKRITKPKGSIPMVKVAAPPVLPARSEDARKARLDVDLMLVDNFDPARGRYRDGWDDDRVAREAGMSVDFVAKRREAEHGPLRHDVAAEKLSAMAAEFSARELALRGRVADAERGAREALLALGAVLNDLRSALADHVAQLHKLTDGK